MTVPDPVPLDPLVTEMNDALLVAVHVHPELIVTDTLPVVAAWSIERLDGDNVALQFGAPAVLCEIMKGWPATVIERLRLLPVVFGSTL